ncbi:hypothetical protein CAC42_283 [Sphaceloma murrayae]|uniref:Uncharacterized protein n=1 Tax=Sphaceloma murrayae TaxID=2082308 RepID=A0A2K1QNQ1_9PEZI|nr:hypothetical protein CAC42_283 [Sphaceloma murrayae]
MCSTSDELRHLARWDGAEGDSRNQLLSELSSSIAPSVMIPEHRLANLLKQVQDTQINNCLYHNTTAIPSLYHDHTCDREDFPLEILTELRDHHDEVWYIAFSSTGRMLASCGQDNNVFIYDTATWRRIHQLNETNINTDVTGVVFLAWSPDDRYLLSCSRANQLTVYDMTDNARRVVTLQNYTYPATGAAWLPDSKHFIVGSQDGDRSLVQYRLGDSSYVHEFSTREQKLRCHDLAVSADGSRMVTITNDRRVLAYDLNSPNKSLIAEINMEEELTSVDLSNDGANVLIGMKNNKLFMLETDTGEFLQRYQGAKQVDYIIRSRFGGAGDGFVISGSEDCHVYIWRRQSGLPVACLPAHAPGPVNAVSWHPTQFGIFASAGDDKKVNIWASQPLIRALTSTVRQHQDPPSFSGGLRSILRRDDEDDADAPLNGQYAVQPGGPARDANRVALTTHMEPPPEEQGGQREVVSSDSRSTGSQANGRQDNVIAQAAQTAHAPGPERVAALHDPTPIHDALSASRRQTIETIPRSDEIGIAGVQGAMYTPPTSTTLVRTSSAPSGLSQSLDQNYLVSPTRPSIWTPPIGVTRANPVPPPWIGQQPYAAQLATAEDWYRVADASSPPGTTFSPQTILPSPQAITPRTPLIHPPSPAFITPSPSVARSAARAPQSRNGDASPTTTTTPPRRSAPLTDPTVLRILDRELRTLSLGAGHGDGTTRAVWAGMRWTTAHLDGNGGWGLVSPTMEARVRGVVFRELGGEGSDGRMRGNGDDGGAGRRRGEDRSAGDDDDDDDDDDDRHGLPGTRDDRARPAWGFM